MLMLGGAELTRRINPIKTSEEVFAQRRDAVAGSEKLLELLGGEPEPEPLPAPIVITLRVDANLPAWVHKVNRVKAAVVREFGISHEELVAHNRSLRFVRPRQVVMYVAKKHTQHSTLEIGRRIGGRDHTVVLHGAKVIEKLIAKDSDLAARVEKIKAALA